MVTVHEGLGPGWVAQFVERHPVNQKVASSIASQGTYLSWRFDLWLGCVWEVTDRCFSLSKINKNTLKKKGGSEIHKRYTEKATY